MPLFSGLEADLECASICARTAKILAARGDGPVCVVDANFQSPSLHRCFGAQNTQGLAEAALESSPLPTFLQQVSESNLWLMPCDQAASQLTFSAITDALRQRTNELREKFRYMSSFMLGPSDWKPAPCISVAGQTAWWLPWRPIALDAIRRSE